MKLVYVRGGKEVACNDLVEVRRRTEDGKELEKVRFYVKNLPEFPAHWIDVLVAVTRKQVQAQVGAMGMMWITDEQFAERRGEDSAALQ